MQKINSLDSLKEAIVQLEIVHAEEGKLLKEQLHLAFESIKPINLIKNTFQDAIATPGLKDNILGTSAGLVAGYVSRLLFVNVSRNPLRKILGSAIQFGVTKLVAKHPDTIKSLVGGMMKFFVNTKKQGIHADHDDNRS